MFESSAEMTAALTTVVDAPTAALNSSQLLDQLDTIRQLESVIAAQKAETMVAFHAALSGPSADLGHQEPRPGDRIAGPTERRWSGDVLRSVTDEIGLVLGAHRRTAACWLNRAALLVDRFPATLALLRLGGIPALAAQHVAKALAVIVDDDLRAAVEELVLAWGRRYGWTQIKRTAIREARKVTAEYDSLLHAQRQDERTTYTVKHDGGIADLVVSTSAIDITAIMNNLTARCRELQQAGDPRTLDQLRTDLAVNRLLGHDQTRATTSTEQTPDANPDTPPTTTSSAQPAPAPTSTSKPGTPPTRTTSTQPDPAPNAAEPGTPPTTTSSTQPNPAPNTAKPGTSPTSATSTRCAPAPAGATEEPGPAVTTAQPDPARTGAPEQPGAEERTWSAQRCPAPSSDPAGNARWRPEQTPAPGAQDASGIDAEGDAGIDARDAAVSAARPPHTDTPDAVGAPTMGVNGPGVSGVGSLPESGLNPAVGVQVVIHCTYAEAEALATGAINTGGELEGYGPLPQDALAMAFNRAKFRYRLTDRSPKSDPARYAPSPGLDQHVRDRDQRCRFPGCNAPVQRCDLDHRVPFPAGPTDESNLGPLCRHHHRLKHHGDWQVHATDTGHLIFISPTGRAYIDPPAMPNAA